jgi:putative peptidoglycan lipid II flippase
VLSRAVARKEQAEERKTFQDTLELSLVLVSPVMVFCLMLAPHIMRLTFQRGNFTPQATALMSEVFFYYSLSLLFFAALRVLSFYLFARQEVGWFVRLSILQYTLMIAFDLLYVGPLRLGAKAIPLALLTSLTLLFGFALRRNLVGLKNVLERPFRAFAGKAFLGSALTALTVWAFRSWLQAPRTGVGNFLYLCLVCGVGSLVFLGTLAASKAFPISESAGAQGFAPLRNYDGHGK